MSEYSIYHNPRCSKSRQTLALLQEQGIEPEIILYLEDTPSTADLKRLLNKLGMPARALLRKGESAYKEHGLADASISDDAIIRAMRQSPKLIERPIVVKDQIAVLGRPPENVLQIL